MDDTWENLKSVLFNKRTHTEVHTQIILKIKKLELHTFKTPGFNHYERRPLLNIIEDVYLGYTHIKDSRVIGKYF